MICQLCNSSNSRYLCVNKHDTVEVYYSTLLTSLYPINRKSYEVTPCCFPCMLIKKFGADYRGERIVEIHWDTSKKQWYEKETTYDIHEEPY